MGIFFIFYSLVSLTELIEYGVSFFIVDFAPTGSTFNVLGEVII
jgi:hypothetical protein